jgi:hypothetical protein
MTGPQPPAEDQQAATSRATLLVWQRFAELVDIGAPPGRRPRTLTTRSAAQETAALAHSSLRSGGVTRPSASPEVAGHGIAMLPDIASEALSLLSEDVVLKCVQSQIVDLLRESLEKVRSGAFSASDLAGLDAYAQTLENSYLVSAFAALGTYLTSRPKHLFDIDRICVNLVSDLRSRGWSDASLAELMQAARAGATSDLEALDSFRCAVSGGPRAFTCYVAVTVTGGRDDIHAPGEFEIVDEAPRAAGAASAPKRGPYARVIVAALDARYAAETAFTRVSSVLGAVAIFVRTDVNVRSSIVTVSVDQGKMVTSVDVRLRLAREPRTAGVGQLRRVAQSALASSRSGASDAVFDAIRHRQRAAEAEDLESRFMLLWLGIERLCLGAGASGKIQESVRALVPRAITLGKLRRDVAALGAAIARAPIDVERRSVLVEILSLDGAHGGIDLRALLGVLVRGKDDPESRRLTGTFYASDVRLAQWYGGLQKDLSGPTPASICEYLDRSRLRIERQCLRLYRARNSVAHAARGPAWLADLVSHAHFYLTQLIAICVHYRERSAEVAAVQVLVSRAGQYDAFRALVHAGHPGALSVEGLLRPTAIVGVPFESAGPPA